MEVLCILRRTPSGVHATLLFTILQIKWCDTCVFRIWNGTISTPVHQVRQLGGRRGVGHDGKSQSASAARWAEKRGLCRSCGRCGHCPPQQAAVEHNHSSKHPRRNTGGRVACLPLAGLNRSRPCSRRSRTTPSSATCWPWSTPLPATTRRQAQAFQELLARCPDYAPGYHQAGRTLVRVGRVDDAKGVLRQGIPIALRANNEHAAGEMRELLESLE